MFNTDIGIDLGTANVLIYVRRRGVVLNEPSVVAIHAKSKEVLAVGKDARQMLGKTPEHIRAIRPLRDGVIADFEAAETMLKHFITKLGANRFFLNPRILICCPTNITSLEKKAIKEVAESLGAKQVYLEEGIKVASIGAGLDIFEPEGNMVVDIGGGTTDVAILSMSDIVAASSIKVAGDTFDQCIVRYIKDKHRLLIGEPTAEIIKMKIGMIFPALRKGNMEICGQNIITGLPQKVTINSDEIKESLLEPANAIVQACKNLLEQAPPELSADIIDHGLFLTGGGALLQGFDRLLAHELRIPVKIAKKPMSCVAEGAGMMLENLDRAPKLRLLSDSS